MAVQRWGGGDPIREFCFGCIVWNVSFICNRNFYMNFRFFLQPLILTTGQGRVLAVMHELNIFLITVQTACILTEVIVKVDRNLVSVEYNCFRT